MVEDILNESIWWNSNIKIDNEVILWKKWLEKGIIRVKDIVDRNQDFLSVDKFKEKFGIKPKFLELQSLISSIPANWKILLRKDKIEDC